MKSCSTPSSSSDKCLLEINRSQYEKFMGPPTRGGLIVPNNSSKLVQLVFVTLCRLFEQLRTLNLDWFVALVILHDLQCISQLDSEALRVYVQFKKWPCELVSLHDFYFFPFAPSLKSIQVIRCLLSVPWRVSKKTPAPKSVWLHWLQTGDTTKASWQIQGKREKEATQRFRVCTRKCDKNMVHLKRKWERRTELTTICVLCNVCGVANVVGWLLCNPSTTPPSPI